jgi:hypothetical protein
MTSFEESRTTFDNLKNIANKNFNLAINSSPFSVDWDEQFGKVYFGKLRCDFLLY